MLIEGQITKVLTGKKFFYIDDIYFCHFNDVDFDNIIEGMKVKYIQSKNQDKKSKNYEKPIAKNVELHSTQDEQSSVSNASKREITKVELVIDKFFSDDGAMPWYLVSDLDDGTQTKKNVKDIGEILSEPGIKPFDGEAKKDKALSITQVRNFYLDFQHIIDQVGDFKQKKISLLMLKANIEYSARRNKLRRFAVMMHNRINIVLRSNEVDFNKNLNAFHKNFEAFVAYFPKKEKGKKR